MNNLGVNPCCDHHAKTIIKMLPNFSKAIVTFVPVQSLRCTIEDGVLGGKCTNKAFLVAEIKENE